MTAFVQSDLLKDMCIANILGRQRQCPPPGQTTGLFSEQDNVDHVFLSRLSASSEGFPELVVPQQWHSSGIHQDLLPHGPRGTWDKGAE